MYYGCEIGYKMAENDLRNYTANRTAIVNLREQIRNLKDEAERIRGATSEATPVRGGGSRCEERLLSNIHAREKLTGALRSTESNVARVERALALLDDEERLLLDRFYINRQKTAIERLTIDLGLERAAVYKHKDAAFRHFLQAMYPSEV